MRTLGLLVAIGVAGGLGAAGRLVVDRLVPTGAIRRFPWGTNVVNVAGSFALGYVVDVSAMPDQWRTILAVGFLGGFTTFSTASLESVVLLTERRSLAVLANSVGALVACVGAASLGMALAA